MLGDMAREGGTHQHERQARNRVCTRCKFSTTDAKDFSQHQLSAHGERLDELRCDRCEFVGTSSIDLHRHRRTHRRGLRAPSTDTETGSTASSDQRVADIDTDPEGAMSDDESTPPQLNCSSLPVRTYTCVECGEATTSAREHLYHLVEEHQHDITVYECDLCEYATKYKHKLPRHRRCHFTSVPPGGAMAAPLTTPSKKSRANHPEPSPRDEILGFTNVTVMSGPSENVDVLEGSPQNLEVKNCNVSLDINMKDLNENVKEHGDQKHPSTADTEEQDLMCEETLEDTSYTEAEPEVPAMTPATRAPATSVGPAPVDCDLACEESVMNNSTEYLPGSKVPDCDLSQSNKVLPVDMQDDDDNHLVIDLGENQNQNNNCPSGLTGQTMTIPVTVNTTLSQTLSQAVSKPAEPIPPRMKLTKKGTVPVREAVDPAKYVRLQDVDGVRYACSKCGNVYKWRKSLNKHWKEKHDGEIPIPTSAAFTMLNIPHIKGVATQYGQSKTSVSASSRTIVSPGSMAGVSSTSSFALEKYIVDRGAQSSVRHLQSPAYDSGSPSPAPSVGSQSEIYGKGAYDVILRPSALMCSTSTPVGSSSSSIRSHYNLDSRGKCSNLEKRPYNSIADKAFSYTFSSGAPPAHSQRLIKKEELEQDYNDMMPLDLSKGSKIKGSGNALDLSKPIGSNGGSLATDQPLDFSRKSNSGSERSTPAASSGQRAKKEAEEFMEALWLRSTSTPDSQPSLYNNLQCYRCPFVAKDKHTFEDHMEQHTSISYPQCAQCKQAFSSNDELTQHFGLHHLHVLHQPDLFDENDPKSLGTSPESMQLFQYLTKPKDNKEQKCIVCSAKFPWKRDLSKHFTHLHPDLPNPYKKHHLEVESGTEPWNKRAKQDKQWQIEGQFAGNDGRNSPEGELECEQCSFIARDPAEMTRHQLVHSLNRPHACTMCGYSTKVRDELTVHIWKYHPSHAEELALMASSGSSPVTSVSGAISSAANYANESPAAADTSGSSGHNSSMEFGFDDVIVVTPNTTDVPLVRGRKCGKGGPSSSAEILLPYKCSVCEYRARWPSEITQHMKNHSDEKPYLCPRCTYKSKWKWDVVKHLKRCGGGTVKDVIDTSRLPRKSDGSSSCTTTTPTSTQSVVKSLQFKSMTPRQSILSNGPPNVTVLPSTSMRVPVSHNQPQSPPAFIQLQSPSEEAYLVPYARSINSPDSSPSRASVSESVSPTPVANSKANGTVFRSIINQGQYHCLQCPFVGNSPAELKRHCRVHSDEKPFACATCGYSSKWKCDLKKHLRTYSHVAAPRRDSLEAKQKEDSYRLMASAIENNLSSSDEMSVDLNPGESRSVSSPELSVAPKPILHKCDKCQYVTYKKNFLEGHMNIHGQAREKKSGKLKCKQCDFEASDLPAFLQHKLTHSSQQDTVSSTGAEPSADLAQNLGNTEKDSSTVRHRRKPLKYLCCSRCPYTCFKPDKLEVHEAMHEPRGPDALTCEFCDYNVYSRGLLIQHMKLHPEFEEWYATNGQSLEEETEDVEEIEMDKAEHTESLCDGAVNLSVKTSATISGGMKLMVTNPSGSGPGFRCKKCPYISEKRSSFEAHIRHHGCSQEFKCEYCDWSVDRLNLLYKHVKEVHPHQLSLRETPEPTFRSDTVTSPTGLERQSSDVVLKDNGDPTEGAPLTAVPRERAGRKKQRKSQTCGQCGYITDNPAKMYQHRLKHSSEEDYKCHYCNTSIAIIGQMREHLLHVHDVHVEQDEEGYNTTPIENATVENTAKEYSRNTQESGNQAEDDKAAKSKKSSEVSRKRVMSHSPSPHRKASPSPARSDGDTSNPDEQTAEPVMMEIKGQQVRVLFFGNRKVFTCPKCTYRSSNSTHCASHVQQHGSGKTYMCEYCDYSLDKLSHILYHMKTCHANEMDASETDTDHHGNKAEKTDEILETAQNGEKSSTNPTGDNTGSTGTINSSPMNTVSGRKLLSCTRCPYGTKSREALHRHMEMHEYKGRYTCPNCDYSVDRMNLLQQHKRVHGPNVVLMKSKLVSKASETPGVRNKAHGTTIGRNRRSAKPLLGKSMLKITSTSLSGKGRMKTRYRCTRCPYTTVCKSNIVKHRRLHLVTSKFRCQQCNYSATRYFLLQQHIKFHATEEEDSAEYQDIYLDPDQEVPTPAAKGDKNMEVGATEARSSQHTEKKTAKSTKVYMCKECPFSSRYSYEWKKHVKFHQATHQYKCDYCTYSIPQLSIMVQHRRLHARQAEFSPDIDKTKLINPSASQETSTEKFECTKCPYTSLSQKNYLLHTSLHGTQKKYKCEYCDLSCDGMKVMRQHRRLHCSESGFLDSVPHSELLNKQKSGQVSRIFSLPKLRIALKPPSPKRCQKKDANQVVQRKLYNCKHCPFACNKKQSYESHSRLHGAAGRYPCSECSYTVDRMNLLQQHARLHNPVQVAARSGARPVKKRLRCSKCPYHTHSQSLLELHFKMHAAGQRYTCEFCDYSIGRQNLLQQHMKIHSTCVNESKANSTDDDELETSAGSTSGILEKSKFYYKCDRCPYQTNNKNNFENHKSQHFVRSKLTCPHCDYSSPRTGQLASHVRLHFPGSHFNSSHDTSFTADDTEPGTPSGGDPGSREGSLEPLNNNNEEDRKDNVCQYCERNFTDKAERDWHEQQHLIGSGSA